MDNQSVKVVLQSLPACPMLSGGNIGVRNIESERVGVVGEWELLIPLLHIQLQSNVKAGKQVVCQKGEE